MAGRIVLAVVALITALLAILAIPLGLLTAAQDRSDFRDQTTAATRTVASVAEERLGDGAHGAALNRSIHELAAAGDAVAIYDAAGRRVAGTPNPGHGTGRPDADRLVVAAPITNDSGRGSVGRIVLSRPTEQLEHRVAVLWSLIGAVAAVGLAVGVLVSVGLARWVSRPLTALADAAGSLGTGALDARAPIASGPPEVRRLASVFNTMAGRLQSLVHGHKSMMADVSHQVRTPLAALRLRLDLLAQDADEATAAELSGAQEEISRLARLVSGLLAVARAENVTAAPSEVAVDAVVADRIAAWRPAAEESGIELSADCPMPVCALACDGHLEQILDNLLANAVRALTPGGTIRVTAETVMRAAPDSGGAREIARIVVADDGTGMSAHEQQRAFRRYSTGSAGGTGLGLAIVDRLAVANGGTASLSDAPGGGLTVTIELLTGRSRRNVPRPGTAAPRPAAGINRI